MEKILFSIVIPAYNLGSLICDAVDSCIRQQGIKSSNYEIIVINDGSTDNTNIYLDKYKNIENVIIINQKNKGLSISRNNGIEIAKGEYVIFLDGDDWLADNALNTLMKYIGTDDLVVFPMLYYYNEKRIEKRGYHLQEKVYNNNEFFHETLGYSQFHVIPAQNKCYKRSILQKEKIYFIPNILHEDNPFFISVILKFNRIRYINVPLYYYRQNREGSITSTCSIRNYNSIIMGTKVIVNTMGYRNRDVNFLLANLHVFQILGNYSTKKDQDLVFKDYRTLKRKCLLIRLLFNSVYRWKHCIRMILLIIDPGILRFIIKFL